jgi:phage shock protein A
MERIKNAIRVNLAEIVDRVDDPDRRLRQFIERMEADLSDARLELGAAVREEERLEGRLTEAESQIADMTERAMLALRQGDDTLAREALRIAERARGSAEDFARQVGLQSSAVSLLREQVSALEGKLEQARRRLELLEARKRLAEAQKAVTRRIGLVDTEISRALGERLDELEARTQAGNEILATEVGAHDGSELRVEERLAELRARLRKEERESGEEGS